MNSSGAFLDFKIGFRSYNRNAHNSFEFAHRLHQELAHPTHTMARASETPFGIFMFSEAEFDFTSIKQLSHLKLYRY